MPVNLQGVTSTPTVQSSSTTSSNALPTLQIPKTFSIEDGNISISKARIPPVTQRLHKKSEEIIAEALNPDATRDRISCRRTEHGFEARFDAWSRSHKGSTADLDVLVKFDHQKQVTSCTATHRGQAAFADFKQEQTGSRRMQSNHPSATQTQLMAMLNAQEVGARGNRRTNLSSLQAEFSARLNAGQVSSTPAAPKNLNAPSNPIEARQEQTGAQPMQSKNRSAKSQNVTPLQVQVMAKLNAGQVSNTPATQRNLDRPSAWKAMAGKKAQQERTDDTPPIDLSAIHAEFLAKHKAGQVSSTPATPKNQTAPSNPIAPSTSTVPSKALDPLPFPTTFSIEDNRSRISISGATIPPLTELGRPLSEKQQAKIAEALHPDAKRGRISCTRVENGGVEARFDAWSRSHTHTGAKADLNVLVKLDHQQKVTFCKVETDSKPDQLAVADFKQEQTGGRRNGRNNLTAMADQAMPILRAQQDPQPTQPAEAMAPAFGDPILAMAKAQREQKN